MEYLLIKVKDEKESSFIKDLLKNQVDLFTEIDRKGLWK